MERAVLAQVELRIPRQAEFVRVARLLACALAAQLDFTYDIVKDIELAVGEACTNAVQHVRQESCHEVLLRFGVDELQLMVDVFDHGKAFDLPESVSPAPECEDGTGLGIPVICAVMDKVEFYCDPEGGTCVRMIKYRARKPA